MSYNPLLAPLTVMVATAILISIPIGMLFRRNRIDTMTLVFLVFLVGATMIDLLLLNWIMMVTYASTEAPSWIADQLPYYLLPGLVFAGLVAAYARRRR